MNKITRSDLLPNSWNACEDGLALFDELFPDGGFVEEIINEAVYHGHDDWGLWIFNHAKNDDRFKDQCLTGYRNTGYRNTGDHNTGNCNTGYHNTGNRNTGDCNTGYRNTGDHNTGYRNTGDCNTGYRNTGNHNTGYHNTGYHNTGDCNTGDHNTGDYNTGHFNTITPDVILVFNKECLRTDWDKAQKPSMFYNISLTYWVDKEDMSDEEKREDPDFYMRGGQLRQRTYKEAWAIAWNNATEEDKMLLYKLPNFDARVFEEITGIVVG